MGLDAYSLPFLVQSVTTGCSLKSTVMIGRQGLYLNPGEIWNALHDHGFPNATKEQCYAFAKEADGFAEPLLRFLGAERIESIDASHYENATIVHDLNEPIPSDLKGAFTCVFDGGCLEHIFNFPQAIKNCMEMVAVGGSFLSVTPTNSFCGHGFYQFSPELFYRVFSVQNGFAIQEMLVWELDPGVPPYRVKDPQALGHRVELASNRPTYLMVLATRTNASDIFEKTPQQSDYTPQWSTLKARSAPEGTQGTWRNRIPYSIRKFTRRLRPEPNPYGSEGFEQVKKYRSALR